MIQIDARSKILAIRGWRTVGDAVFNVDRRAVTLTLADGGDTDGNGRGDRVILDPGGVGMAAGAGDSSVLPNGKAGAGGVCQQPLIILLDEPTAFLST